MAGLTEQEAAKLREAVRDAGPIYDSSGIAAAVEEILSQRTEMPAEWRCWCGSPAEMTSRGIVDCLADRMHDISATGANLERPDVTFERLASQAHDHTGNLVGWYITADDWRAVRGQSGRVYDALHDALAP